LIAQIAPAELAAWLADAARPAPFVVERELVLVCHHGGRSQHAAMWLAGNGYSRLFNLRGGVDAWANDVDPAMPRY